MNTTETDKTKACVKPMWKLINQVAEIISNQMLKVDWVV